MFSYVVSLVHVEVSVHVPLVGAIDGASHTRPCLLEGQHTLNVVPMDLLARNRVNDGGLDAEEWQRRTSGLGGRHTGQGGDDVGSRLSLPVRLHDFVSIPSRHLPCFIHISLTSTT